MKNTQIRRLFCVLLVLCLLCSCIAVPAFATEAALFAVKSVTASLAMDGLIRGLGVLPVDSESGAFGTLVNNCVSYVESVSDFIVDGVCRVSGVRTGDGFTSFLPIGIAQLVWQWLFDSSAVTEVTGFVPDSSAISQSTLSSRVAQALANYPYVYVVYRPSDSGLTWVVIYSQASISPEYDSNGAVRFDGNGSTVYQWGPYGTASGAPAASIKPFSSVVRATSDMVSYQPFEGLSLGQIESPYDGGEYPILLQDAPVYAPWTEHTYSIPSYSNQDEFVSGLPVSIPDSSTSALTQSQAQAGTNSLDWAQTDTETDGVTLANILSAITSLPVKLVSTVTQGIANFFGITGTADSYAISLKDFFPFCIPFDLYEFFTVLAAPPEAPVIEWEIPAPMFGGPFQLEVDLSAWDDIAALFRTFELLAFIVGLALITREKFLRS